MKKIFLTAACLLLVSSPAFAAKQTLSATDTGAQSRTKLNANFTELYDEKSDKTTVVRYWSDWPTTEPNNVLAVNTIVGYEGKFYKVTQQLTKTGSTADPETLTAYFSEVGKVTAADLGLGTSDNPSFNSVHASGGNLAAANAQVTKKWITGLSYTADVTSVIHGGKHWIAKSTHTAGSTTEPGVGANYADAWTEVTGGSMSWPASDGAYYAAKDGAWTSLASVYQPLDSDLTAFAGLTCTENQIPKRNSSNVWICGADNEGAGGGISHAASDGNYYGSRNGAWANLGTVFAAVLGSDDNYVTDAEKVKLSNLSGTNTGDQSLTSLGIPGIATTGISGTLTFTKTGTTARTVTFPDAAGTVAMTSDIVAAPTDATISTSDVTTNNASTTKHGWLLKATAPSSGLRNIVAIDNAETVYKNAALFDATSPSTQASGDAAVVGTAMTAARRDHKHAMPTIPTASDTAYDATSWNGNTDVPTKNAVRDKIESLGGGVSLSAENTWTAAQTFSSGVIASSYTSSAADGARYSEIPNTVALSSTPTLGRIAWLTDRFWLANGTNWTSRWLLDSSLIDTSSELRGLVTDESGTGALLFAGGDIGAGTATTPSANDNDTSIATTAYVQSELSAYASDTVTLTNKTYDTAGIGNSLTVPLNGVLNGAITDPADADDMIYVKAPNAMTITDIHCLAEGGGTITITLQECSTSGGSCANIEGAITCDADGAEDDGTLTDGSIASGAWIKVLYSAPTGTVNNVAWSVYGTQTW